ncbi:Cyclin-dependent kinase-like 5 [Paramecium bursaria]
MNKYEIQGVVGEGAYGIVLKSKNKETGEFVAIKKFKETEDDEIVRKSIQREVKMLRMLKHPNIIGLKEAFKKKGKIFLVFQFVDKNLLELLEEKRCLDQELIRKLIFQLFLAINCCHQQGIIHRDVKPENLLIDSENNLKLCDFGFARILNQEQLTDYVATRWYRSPELLLSNQYGKSVDIWAAGCIMGEMIDGQPLFPGENEMDQLYVIQKIIGPLTQQQLETFQKNPRYLGMKFPEISKQETIERRYQSKISSKGMEFLKLTLQMDPDSRPTAQEALEHPYLSDLWAKETGCRPFSYKRRISQERDESKPLIAQYDLGQNKKIVEKVLPQTLQNQSLFQQTITYNYKIEDTHDNKDSQQDEQRSQMQKTFNQSFRIKQQETQSRLGSENQDKRVKIQKSNHQSQQHQQTPKIQAKSPAKKQIPQFYIQGQYNVFPQKVQQLNLIYNANTFNYSIKKQNKK